MATTLSGTKALEWLLQRWHHCDPYEYLIQRKFPDYNAVRYAPISLFDIGGSAYDDREKRLKEVKSFRAELKAKPLKEIETLYDEEQERERQEWAAEAEREERQRFFNQPEAKADFAHWSKVTYWTLDEAIALAFGRAPEAVKWENVKGYVTDSPFAKRYAWVRDLALRAKNCKQLFDPTPPSLFLPWARRNEIDVAPELVKGVEARGVVIADWKDCYDKLNEQAKKLSEQQDELTANCTKLTAERDALKRQVEEAKSAATVHPIHESERDSLLRMVLGMAMTHYKYEPGAPRKAATGEKRGSIPLDLGRLGLTLDADTVRKFLKEAEDRFAEILANPRKH